MTHDEILRLAKEAGFGNYAYEAASLFERFAQLVAEQERDACAKVCEQWAAFNDMAQNCAWAIRHRTSLSTKESK